MLECFAALEPQRMLRRSIATSSPLLLRRHDLKPYVVHATFQKWHFEGKRSRFRENNLWLLDKPSYYSEGGRDVELQRPTALCMRVSLRFLRIAVFNFHIIA